MEELMEQEKITVVQNSYGRSLANGDMLDTFYKKFLSSHSDIEERFKNTDFEQQKKLLRHGINLMIMHAAGNVAGKSGLNRIRESHSRGKMNIQPKYYSHWKKALIDAISQHDRKFDDTVRKAWEKVLDNGIAFISAGY